MEEQFFNAKVEDREGNRLPWRKPEVQLLIVSVDTAAESKGGSAIDGPAMDRLVGPPVD